MAAAETLVGGKWATGETAEQFAVRMSQYQQVIAACNILLGIPYAVIEQAKEIEQEEQNG